MIIFRVGSPFILSLLMVFSVKVTALEITMMTLPVKPVIDGQFDEWSGYSLTKIPLSQNKENGNTRVSEVRLAGGVHLDEVFIYVQWQDSTLNMEHKPFIWNEAKGRYVKGPQREDRIAIQFEISGEYDTNWYSGKEFVADMWHWKSFRSNPLGLVHDKLTVISKEKMRNSIKVDLPSGPIYIKRPSDAGDRIYKSTRYGSKVNDVMPKYTLIENAQGSVADIRAKGVWADGVWRVEMSRAMNTGNDDDVVFNVGKAVKGGIAVFDGTGDDDHTISDTLIFQF